MTRELMLKMTPRAFLPAALATGCLSVPPYTPENAVTFTASGGGGGVVAGQGFSLRFADGGFHFPDALVIGGDDVIGRNPAATCAAEDEIGLVLQPALRISASSSARLVSSQLVPVLRGPAIVQVQITWATSFECDSSRTPGGTATYTVFPDGGIVRHDTFADPKTMPISPGPCACPGEAGGLFDVSTFWTLTQARYTSLLVPGEGDEPKPLPLGQSYTNKDTACMSGDAHQVAFAWHDPSGTVIRGSGDRILFGRELEIGETELESFSYEDGSAIFIGTGSCDVVQKRAVTHTQRPPLKVSGTPVRPSTRDGIYGSDVVEGGDGTPGIPVSGGRVELEGPVDGSFAVWLRFPGAVEGVRARLEGAQGPWYMPQRVDDRSWIVWFRDAITTNQKIVVESF